MANRETPSPDVGRAIGVVLDAVVVSPIEAGVRSLRDPVGTAQRVRRELRLARAVGQFATSIGAAKLRERIERRGDDGTETAAEAPPSPEPPADDTGDPVVDAARPADRRRARDTSAARPTGASSPSREVPAADDLALPDYDQLPAIDIVGRLDDLDPAERASIERYERAHRRRRTVLGKIAQLAEGTDSP